MSHAPSPLLNDERWAQRALGARRPRGRGRREPARDRAVARRPAEPEFELPARRPTSAARAAAEAAVETLERYLDRHRRAAPRDRARPALAAGNLPAPPPPSIVHGDFRLSNLVVAEDGRPTLIDWEFVHAGDGAEDLGWMCVRSWRFGAAAARARLRLPRGAARRLRGGRRPGGVARRAALVGGVRQRPLGGHLPAAGRPAPDRRRPLARAGDDRAPDLRGGVGPARAARRRPPAAGPCRRPQDGPDAHELLETVAEYLRDLRARARPPRTPSRSRSPPTRAGSWPASCRRTTAAPRARAAKLAAALAAGEHDAGLDALVDPLRAEVRAKLEVANPRWIG